MTILRPENEREELYLRLVERWGEQTQIDMAVEECAEFIQAVNKLRRAKGSPVEQFQLLNLRAEIADVLNCMEQMRIFFHKESIDEYREQKLKKAESKMQNTNP